MYETWDRSFIKLNDPSIGFLELFAVAEGILNWINKYSNQSIVLFCDNKSAADMINSTTSSCKHCMKLIWIIVLQGMIHNVKINARHVRGVANDLSDYLSRGKIQAFKDLAALHSLNMNKHPTEIPHDIWPVEKIWYD